MTTPNNPLATNLGLQDPNNLLAGHENDPYIVYLDKLNEYEKANGIKRTAWSLIMPNRHDNFPIADFPKKHPFVGVKWVTDGQCPSLTKIKGDTWLDIWLACERMKMKHNDYHNYIERLTQKGKVLEVSCGS